MADYTASDFIRFKQHIVPWVSRWDGEVNADPLRVARNLQTGALTLFYADADPQCHRDCDEYGVLWSREGQDRSGLPEFGEVNTARQRVCMRERLCQVCGQTIEPGPIHWLLALDHLYAVQGHNVTMSPPTCRGCVDLARKHCPHLSSKGSRLLLVQRYEVWGVYGELSWFDKAGQMHRETHKGISYAQPEQPLSGVLAKQLMVSLIDVTEVKSQVASAS